MGRLGWTPQTFYRSTLRDLFDAAIGFNEFEHEKLNWQLFSARKIMWSNLVIWDKNVQEEKLLKIPELDQNIIKAKIKSMKPITVTKLDGKGQ